MSKRNVTYVKPQEPTFLRLMKEQIGYREGPTVDTKRQKIEDLSDSDSDYEGRSNPREREEEQPQVVVLREGDLTAEQAEAEKVRLAKEEREKPADLNERIIFKSKHKPTKDNQLIDQGGDYDGSSVKSSKDKGESNASRDKQKKKKKSKHSATSTKLSFNQDEEEAEEY